MGNGASVPLDYQSCDVGPDFSNKFAKLEKRVKSGFFEHAANEEEYLRVTTNAIEKQHLDILEILIKGGDLKSLYPLHIAAKSSSVEAMDLLLSAGLSPFQINLQGKTPLHVAAQSHTEESVLCVNLLLMHGEKALRMQDKSGNTPLHCAVSCNNVAAVELLLTHGASLTITNKAGNSPRHLAKSLNHTEILDIIDEKRTGKLRKKKDKEQTSKMTKYQQERIMKVWEKFFENAFIGLDIDMDMDSENDEVGQRMGDAMPNESKAVYSEYNIYFKESHDNVLFKKDQYAQNDTCLYPSDSKDFNYNFSFKNPEKISYKYDVSTASYKEVYEEDILSSPSLLPEDDKDKDWVFQCASEWFSWILTYEHDCERRLSVATTTGGDGTDGYYVANCFALGHNFDLLADHLDRLDQFGLWQGYDAANRESRRDESYGCGGYSETSQQCAYFFPASVKSAIAAGWINFFDIETNSCCWMHVSSGLTELFLPLGYDELAWDLGLEQHCVGVAEDDGNEAKEEADFDIECWLKPPQVAARSWVLVSIQPPTSCATSYNEENRSPGEKEEEEEEEEEEEVIWYYSNRVTGHSRWEKPMGWSQLLREAGGWVLCADESAPADLYWWHSESGDVVWYNEDYATE